MSTIIKNTAQIIFDGGSGTPTCPVVTTVEPNIGIYKYAVTEQGKFDSTGTIGKNRKVTYEVLLVNYSSTKFTNVVVKDILTLPEGVTVGQITYIDEESSGANEATLPNIQFTVGELPAESQQIVHYTLRFDESVPIGTVIKNKANVNYTENPNGEDPFESEEITLTISYPSIESKKTAPDSVLCGQEFPYTLTFKNTGEVTVEGVKVVDNLPKDFTVSTVTVTNGNSGPLTEDTNYTIATEEKTIDGTVVNVMTITGIAGALDVASNDTLTVVITGSVPCPVTP